MLSKKCQYALHALVFIAGKKHTTVQSAEIFQSKNIPRKFLESILLDLKRAGILGSKQGKGGGYYLKRKPEEISVMEIIRLTDGAIAMLPCVSLKYYESCGMCEDEPSCQIRRVFANVRDETLKVLSKTFVADLTSDASIVTLAKNAST